jgi:hypothetical protein
VSPYDVKFAQSLKVPEFVPRGFLAGIDALTTALDDPEPLVREHAAWALAPLTAQTRR